MYAKRVCVLTWFVVVFNVNNWSPLCFIFTCMRLFTYFYLYVCGSAHICFWPCLMTHSTWQSTNFLPKTQAMVSQRNILTKLTNNKQMTECNFTQQFFSWNYRNWSVVSERYFWDPWWHIKPDCNFVVLVATTFCVRVRFRLNAVEFVEGSVKRANQLQFVYLRCDSLY